MPESKSKKEEFVEDHLKEIGWPDQAQVERAKFLLSRVKRILLRQPGARAVDVGFRIVQKDNRFTDEIAIRVHVQNKLTEKEFSDGRTAIDKLDFYKLARVHKETFFDDPDKTEGVIKLVHDDHLSLSKANRSKKGFRLDVVEARYLPSMGSTEVSQPRLNTPCLNSDELKDLVRSRVNPLVGGVSIGNDLGQAGTLGAVVWDQKDGAPCLLSNWHVLAGSRTANRESRCFQPSLVDGGSPNEDFVGHFKRGLFDRNGDAALASIDSGRAYSTGEILGLWAPVAGTVEPKLGMPVRKFGRTTGFTRGFIDGVGFTVNLEYEGVGTRFFEDQVHIAARIKGEEVSAPGDSGAVWVTKYFPKDKKDNLAEVVELVDDRIKSRIYFAVALNFAGDVPGTPSGEFAIASSIPKLAKRLKFAFRPLFFPPSGLVIRPGQAPASPAQPATTQSNGPVGNTAEPVTGQGDPASTPQPEGRRIIPP